MRIPAVPPAPTIHQRGFTLVELAIVMFIVALLLGGMLLPLSAQQDIRARQETEKLLGDTRDALLGYAVVNGYLPCPDTTGDGVEDVTGTGSSRVCTSADGASADGEFPYQTVGTQQADGYNFRLRYSVSSNFSKTIALANPGNIIVITRGDDPTTTGTTESKKENILVTTAPAVIYSVGKNGYGGLPNGGGTRISGPAAGTDEARNYSGATKVSRTPMSISSGCADTETEGTPLCEFDDQLVWLSANTIFNRLVASGKL